MFAIFMALNLDSQAVAVDQNLILKLAYSDILTELFPVS